MIKAALATEGKPHLSQNSPKSERRFLKTKGGLKWNPAEKESHTLNIFMETLKRPISLDQQLFTEPQTANLTWDNKKRQFWKGEKSE